MKIIKTILLLLLVSNLNAQSTVQDCRTKVTDMGYYGGKYHIKITNLAHCQTFYHVIHNQGTESFTPLVNGYDSIIYEIESNCVGKILVLSAERCSLYEGSQCVLDWLSIEPPCGILGIVPIVKFRQKNNEVEVWVDFEDYDFKGKSFSLKINLDNRTSKEVDFTLTEKRNGLWYHKYRL